MANFITDSDEAFYRFIAECITYMIFALPITSILSYITNYSLYSFETMYTAFVLPSVLVFYLKYAGILPRRIVCVGYLIYCICFTFYLVYPLVEWKEDY